MKKIRTTILVVMIAFLYIYLSNKGYPVFDSDLISMIPGTDFLYTTSIPSNEGIITIGSFNIETFGIAKREKEDVMSVLVTVLCKFDVLAVQEIRDKSETTIEYYVALSNDLCEEKRDFIMSPRLGRTSSKENYAFIYNTETISYEGEEYLYSDEDDDFEREPYSAKFKSGEFDFVLVNTHIKPDDAENEIAKLSEIVTEIKEYFDEENIIITGDLNADCSYFDESKKEDYFFGFKWIIPDRADTTVGKSECAYDRIIISEEALKNYKKEKGVFMFDKVYKLEEDLKEAVSDHYPVWANFEVKI